MTFNYVSDEKFTLDGISSDSVNIWVDYLPPMPLAEQRYTDSNTGADEQLTTPDEVFSNITYVIRFYTFFNEDYNDTAIKAFCFGKSRLTLSRFPDYYFKIKKVSLQASDSLGLASRIDYTLTLTLAPFRYTSANEWVQLSSGDTILNEHTRYSKPLFEITGTGDITLTVNSSTFTVSGLTTGQTITIDTSRHITYSGSTLLTGQTDGEYPMLGTGVNSVSWTGTVTAIKYKGNWRDY